MITIASFTFYELAFFITPFIGLIGLFYLASISGHLSQLRAEIQELKEKNDKEER